MFLAATLNALPGITALHEGHIPGMPPIPRLPLINFQNRKAWHDPQFAEQTILKMRNAEILSKAAAGSDLIVDLAFYNSAFLAPLAKLHPEARLFTIFRRCEPFVRSATIVHGEDRQPAGWPDKSKPLTDREQFISLGRLKPVPGSDADTKWSDWTAIQRNIWLWSATNQQLCRICDNHPNCHRLLFENLVDAPETFWRDFLTDLGVLSQSNLSICIERSTAKVNQRTSYHIGPVTSWTDDEQALYAQLAIPLEKRIYG